MTRSREAAEHPELIGGERRAERRHHLADARLRERDDVEIPLDDDDPPALPDGVARQTETVQRAPLVEERRLGRVEVLGRRVAGARRAGRTRPPNAITRPRGSAIGKIERGRGSDRAARRQSRRMTSPTVTASSSDTACARRWRASASPPPGA